MTQPLQPLIIDEHSVLRFQRNAIVAYVIDWCSSKNGAVGYKPVDPRAPAPDLNELARMDFPQEDRVQLAQLIGYSLDGFAELPYVTDKDYARAFDRRTRGMKGPGRWARGD